MKTVKYIILIWVLVAIFAGIFGKVSIAAEPGTTTAGFLKVGVGAKATGLAGAFTSVADDPSAVYWNPAGLSFIESNQMQFSHYNWYQDIKVENLYAAFPGQKFSLGVGITYLDFGEFQSYDINGDPGEELSMYNISAAVSMAYNLNDYLTLGLTGKYIEQSFDVVKGSAFAGDFGVIGDFDKFRLGLSVANVGSKMTFVSQQEELPSEVRCGLSVRHFNDNALLSVEAHAPFKGSMSLHNGVEVRLTPQLFARSGVVYRTETQNNDSFSYNIGGGLCYGNGRFDYTFVPSDTYGSDAVHNFSISVSW